jgi:RNA polymerase sigma-70 factor (ECF subfamily)
MIELTDAELVKQCLEGDRAAFGVLVDRYQKPVFNAALRIVGNGEDAADITQVVFLKAYERLRSYKPNYKFFSWLYRIAVNESINFAKARRQHEEIDDSIPAEDGPGGEETPEAVEAIVEEALQALSLEHRLVLILCHLQELSYREAGYVLDLPEKTVKSRLFTARKVLKDVLIRKGRLDERRTTR